MDHSETLSAVVDPIKFQVQFSFARLAPRQVCRQTRPLKRNWDLLVPTRGGSAPTVMLSFQLSIARL